MPIHSLWELAGFEHSRSLEIGQAAHATDSARVRSSSVSSYLSTSTAPEPFVSFKTTVNTSYSLFPLKSDLRTYKLSISKGKAIVWWQDLALNNSWNLRCVDSPLRNQLAILLFIISALGIEITSVPSLAFNWAALCSSSSAQSLAKLMLNFNKSFFLLSKCQSSTTVIHLGGVAYSFPEILSGLLVML